MTGSGSYTEWAAGDATNPTLADAHDQAIKTAESQAFKRCAVNLGDQFGLSLYKNGSTDATVLDVVGRDHAGSGQVPDLLQALCESTSEADLSMVAAEIAALDLSDADKEQLRVAYKANQARLTEVS